MSFAAKVRVSRSVMTGRSLVVILPLLLLSHSLR